MVVYELGRIWLTGNTGSGTVQIRRVSDNVLMATATIDLSTGTTDQFNWTAITPVSLDAGTYYLYSVEVSGGNQWRDLASYTASLGSIVRAVYSFDPSTGFVPFSVFGSNTYVPVNFKYA